MNAIKLAQQWAKVHKENYKSVESLLTEALKRSALPINNFNVSQLEVYILELNK